LLFSKDFLLNEQKLEDVDHEKLGTTNVARLHIYLNATSRGIWAADCQRSGQPGNQFRDRPRRKRIDAPDTDPPRFPLQNVPIVRRRLAALFSERAEALVCSAACGADLVALEEAERFGLRRRIVLPFPPTRFRETSVTDRPGDWGPVFDRLVAAAEAAGDLVILQSTGDDNDAAYAAAVQAIIREAEALARPTSEATSLRLIGVIVWEGSAREGIDASGGLQKLATQAGFEERSLLTR
jgi:hypothetical protein